MAMPERSERTAATDVGLDSGVTAPAAAPLKPVMAPSVSDARSPPAEKARCPAPVSTITRTAASSVARSSATLTPRRQALLKVFMRAARFSVMTATAPWQWLVSSVSWLKSAASKRPMKPGSPACGTGMWRTALRADPRPDPAIGSSSSLLPSSPLSGSRDGVGQHDETRNILNTDFMGYDLLCSARTGACANDLLYNLF